MEDTKDVIFVHKITDNYVMTVSKNGQIKYWYVEDFTWLPMPCECPAGSGTIVYSSISSSNSRLALLNDEQSVTIYKLSNLEARDADTLKIESFMKHEYKSQLSICQFSHDGKYLAVALDTGDISVSITPKIILSVLDKT